MMDNETVFYILGVLLAVISMVYVIWNIRMQNRAEKILEKVLKKNQSQLYKKLNHLPELTKSWKPTNEHSLENFEEAYLIYFLKNQIENLEEDERNMMTKVFERKSNKDQVRYAYKIFSEAGLANLFDSYEDRQLISK